MNLIYWLPLQYIDVHSVLYITRIYIPFSQSLLKSLLIWYCFHSTLPAKSFSLLSLGTSEERARAFWAWTFRIAISHDPVLSFCSRCTYRAENLIYWYQSSRRFLRKCCCFLIHMQAPEESGQWRFLCKWGACWEGERNREFEVMELYTMWVLFCSSCTFTLVNAIFSPTLNFNVNLFAPAINVTKKHFFFKYCDVSIPFRKRISCKIEALFLKNEINV